MLRLEVKELAYEVKDVLATFFGRYELLYMVREENSSDFIVVLNGRKSYGSGDVGYHFPFLRSYGT